MDKLPDGSYSSFVAMPIPSLELDILASSFYHDTREKIVINRQRTQDEIKRDELAEKNRIEAEALRAKEEAERAVAAKKAEAERLLAEQKAAAKVAAEKAAWDRTKA